MNNQIICAICGCKICRSCGDGCGHDKEDRIAYRLVNRLLKPPIKKGDYCIAMKYKDGDPGDSFAVGFFDGIIKHPNLRYMITGDKEIPFRRNGFGTALVISEYVGGKIVGNIKTIENSGMTVWFWLWKYMKEEARMKATTEKLIKGEEQ